MKHYFLLLVFIISVSSCDYYEYESKDYESAGILYLQEELKAYFDYYEANETLRFKKETIGVETIRKALDPVDSNKSESINYWVFNREGTTESIINGWQEEQKLTYIDEDGHRITLKIRSKAYLPRATGEWERVQDQFTLYYSEPCGATYIDFITKAYRGKTWSVKKETIMVPSMVVGGKTYSDVIKLKTIKDGSHFAFYITKLDGIIKIDNLDFDVSWIKDS